MEKTQDDYNFAYRFDRKNYSQKVNSLSGLLSQIFDIRKEKLFETQLLEGQEKKLLNILSETKKDFKISNKNDITKYIELDEKLQIILSINDVKIEELLFCKKNDIEHYEDKERVKVNLLQINNISGWFNTSYHINFYIYDIEILKKN